MITSLSIKNFALIEKLDINFSSGFSVITGETGAGKSILLGALGLVLGKRADLTSLKNNEEKCIIEAHFDIQKYNLNNFFEANDLDYETNTTIRREILVSGKSRAFINDTPVNLALLQELSTHLLDIHSQHQTQELSDEAMQFTIIDAIANNKSLLADYEKNLRLFKKLNTLFKQKTDLLQASKNEQEYNTYLLEELLTANFKSGDLELLETSVEKGSNIELIKENLSKSISLFSDENAGVNTSLNDLKAALSKISGFSADYKNIFDRIASVS
ncbi:MAG: AAA family ATPase, partial [Flavobacterium sp.]|nr:AAA family ATPase [Flavobacterium sp.]